MMKFKHIAMIQWLPVTIWWWLQWYVQYSLVLVENKKHLTLEEIISCWSVLSWEGWLLYKSDWWVEETGLESKCAEIQLGPTLVQSMWIIISRENLSKAKGTQESMTHTELHSVHMNSVQLCLCAVLHRQKLCLARKHADGLQHSKRGRESSAGSGHSAVTIPPSLLIHKTKMPEPTN